MSPSCLSAFWPLLLLPVIQGQTINTFPSIDATSCFAVESTDALSECSFPSSLTDSLTSNGFTKVACPFGVLVAATADYDDTWIQVAANTIANILDEADDGVADDLSVLAILTDYNNNAGAGLFCGISQSQEQQEENVSSETGVASFSCQTWKLGDAAGSEPLGFLGILQEESYHLVQQTGYAGAYPDQFGVDDFTTSIVAREAASLQCVQPGWWHVENTCPSGSPFSPGNPAASPLPGTCNEANCDVIEFAKQAMFVYVGASPDDDPTNAGMWFSDYMPRTQTEVTAMLSDDFKNMVADPQYHQITKPLSASRSGCGGGGGGGDGGGAGADGDSPCMGVAAVTTLWERTTNYLRATANNLGF